MMLTVGARLGPYEIQSAIGAGGMGEVYRACDTKLDRDVAIKILPELFAADPERIARFRREAKTLASLNHPNIGGIYGLEDTGDVNALVLELVEGPTLADRIAQGPIPLDEALPIARQIAEALEAAHEHGIIHRDLKPANIKLRPDGTVKVLDFGLAKALDPSPSVADASQSPTITSPAMTHMGVILGTAAYMSPEQARGKPVDKRADIWAFGCVLYEMLTGKRAFLGDDVSETLAAVLKSDPDWNRLPLEAPPGIRKLLRRCVEKDAKRRVPEIALARFEIDEVLTAPPSETAVPRGAAWGRTRALTLGLGLLAGAISAGAAVWLNTRPVPARVVRLALTPSGMTALGGGGGGGAGLVAISPDGSRLAYAGPGQIVVRAFDQLEPTAAMRVGAVDSLFFSPDGQWIGFSDNVTALKKVAMTGGPPITVSGTNASLRGASWSTDDTIIFAVNDANSGLFQVAAAGGERHVLTTPNRAQGEVFHSWPEVLPGGHAVLYTITAAGGTADAQIAVLDLRTRVHKILIRGGSHARYVSSGHLVYGVAGTLQAVAFDLNHLEVVGAPVPVLEQVMTTGFGAVNISLSRDGTLVYVPGGVGAGQGTLVWVDRQGREEALKAPPRGYAYPRLSPDGARLAVSADGGDIWILDLARETMTRFTFDPANDQYPVWTPDGRRLAFRSQRGGSPYNLFWQTADGTGPVERLTESPNEQSPHAFSPDGTRLLIREERPATGADLALLTLEGERRVETLVQTTFTERNPEISPDGRWLAYQSDESGQFEIYVRPFPDTNSGRWQISTDGGSRPLWARAGRELFYVAPDGALMGVPVQDGSTFRAGIPTRLVEERYSMTIGPGRQYDVSPDGRRFLVVKPSGGSDQKAPLSIIVVQNWLEELKRLVPR